MLSAGPPVYPSRGRIEAALDLLFPPTCVGCRRVGRWICSSCWPRILWLGDGQETSPAAGSALTHVRGVAMFEGVAREAVHALKFEGRHAIAPFMGRLMAQRARGGTVDAVIPVPLHGSRRRERGYDQAKLLAKHTARSLGAPEAPDTLTRVRKTKQQTSLDGARRRENVRGAFATRSHLGGERVLLVDDVYTTGATMDEAARTLLEAGAGSVVGLVFARADQPATSAG